ncbi:MAG: alkaline phosphatase family protein [Thermoanaerobaculia bacterium]
MIKVKSQTRSSTYWRRGAASAFLGLLVLSLIAGTLACGDGGAKTAGGKRVILLGFDGMDYEVTTRLMAEGRLPNLSRLAEMGSFSSLETAVPPQSPVAWSNFITGMDSGGHGIYDFVHRRPETMMPYLSTSHTEDADKYWQLGGWKIPLGGAEVELLRRGQPFWEVLEEAGVETTIIRMPANFPPSGTATRELSGMGTPDLVGTSGTFSFYTSELFAFEDKEDISGGHVYEVYPYDNMVEATLVGPDNPFRIKEEELEAPFVVYIDPDEDLVKLVLGDQERILAVGEWSDWLTVEFEMAPLQTLNAIVRFYLKQAHPELELYATPLNMDPKNPAMPISTPESYADELAEATSLYYTQEMPEDTKALSGGIFDYAEFLDQARLAGEQMMVQFEYVLDHFEDGLLFYYFGNLDQISHMLWRAMDPEHPAYDADVDGPYANAIEDVYVQFDGIVGFTLERMGEETTLIVMSDHGFTSWRRTFNLNTWLKQNGYITFKDPNRRDDPGLFLNVDWSESTAYALGLNGLYINLEGRERDGIVAPGDREDLMDELAAKLLAIIDPVTGEQAITKVYKREEVYQSRGNLDIGPDLVVGYAKGTRASGGSAMGEFPPEIIEDNTDWWSGDHCMDHEAVPGILLVNRPLAKEATSLKNLAAAVLAEFGIDKFPLEESQPSG